MFKKLMNKKLLKNQKGLTLIELLAVIVILAIVAAIAVPAIGNIIENSRYNAVKADAINVLNAGNLYFTDNPTEASVTVAKLKTEKYLDNAGKLEGDTTTPASSFTVNKPTATVDANNLTATNIKFSGSKTVSFTGATIISINADITKGSKISGSKNIDHTVPTP